MPSTSVFSTNTSTINDIFLRTLGRRHAVTDTNDLHVVYNLAHSCPLVEGDAVYKARALYGLYFPLYNFDDGMLCAASTDSAKKMPAKAPISHDTVAAAYAKVVPNPATDKATVLYFSDNSKVNTVYVYDNIGELVLSKTDLANSGIIELNVSNLPIGVYMVRVTTDRKILLNSKLIIAR